MTAAEVIRKSSETQAPSPPPPAAQAGPLRARSPAPEAAGHEVACDLEGGRRSLPSSAVQAGQLVAQPRQGPRAARAKARLICAGTTLRRLRPREPFLKI